jgi:hypothetical protein
VFIQIILERFCSRFSPDGIVLYVRGGQGELARTKTKHLRSLGAVLNFKARIPDVVVYIPAKNRILLIEDVSDTGPMDEGSRSSVREMFSGSETSLVFVAAFASRASLRDSLRQILWETAVWVADDPDHLIHFDGGRLFGPFADAAFQ